MIETVIQYKKATEFVGAWIEYKQAKRAGLSMRRLCELLDLKSPSYLKLVLDGKRGFTSDLGEKLSGLMGLNVDQREYFFALIEHESATEKKIVSEPSERCFVRVVAFEPKFLSKNSSRLFRLGITCSCANSRFFAISNIHRSTSSASSVGA